MATPRPPCHGLTGLFFAPEKPELEEAARLCWTCDDRLACREGAEARNEQNGVWGGRIFTRFSRRGKATPAGRKPRRWSAEEDAALIDLRQRGMTWGQIAVQLGRAGVNCGIRYRSLMDRSVSA